MPLRGGRACMAAARKEARANAVIPVDPPRIKNHPLVEVAVGGSDATILRLCQGLAANTGALDHELGQILATKGGHEGLCRKLFSNEVWGSYDPEMVAHVQAIARLMKLLAAVNPTGVFGKHPIFAPKSRIVDIASGTGSIEDVIRRRFQKQVPDIRKLEFNLVDLSGDMLDGAMRKLTGFNVKPLVHDILGTRKLPFEQHSMDAVILSQMLCFMIDREVAIREVSEKGFQTEGSPHTKKRLELVEKMVGLLRENGYIVFIDEDPMLYTINPTTPKQFLQQQLFQATSRPIQLQELLEGVIKNLTDQIHFVCHFEVPIDRKHRMYLMVYRADDRKHPHPSERPVFPEICFDASIRENAVGELKTALARMATAARKRSVEGKIATMNSDTDRLSGKYSRIIIPGLIHTVGNGERKAMIGRAAEALEVGGVIDIIDEFPAPGLKYPISSNNLRYGLMRTFGDQLTFVGALNLHLDPTCSSDMTGYQYRLYR